MKIKDTVIPFMEDVLAVLVTVPDYNFNLQFWKYGDLACAIGHCAQDSAFSEKYQLTLNKDNVTHEPMITDNQTVAGNGAVAYLMRGNCHHLAGDPDIHLLARFLFNPYFYRAKGKGSVINRLKSVLKYLRAGDETDLQKALDRCLKNLGDQARTTLTLTLTNLLEAVREHNTEPLEDLEHEND